MNRKGTVPSRVLFAVLSICTALACTTTDSSPDDSGDPSIGPSRLSEAGLYADLKAQTVAAGVTRFAPAHPLWSDGAKKKRYLVLPPGTKVDTRDMDHWVFPVGTKAFKEFWVDGKLVETRMLWKRRPEPGIESWWRAAYVWEADGSDAIAHPEGVPSALGTTHDVPSQEDCKYCHMYARDAVIGFSAMELSQPSSSNEPPDPEAGLLLPFAQQGLFTNPPAKDFVAPGSGVVRDALSYLHGNCGFCHNQRMEELIFRKMRWRLLTTDTVPEQTAAYTTTFHTKKRHIMEGGIDEAIVPGDPDRSQAYRRMSTPDLVRMPPKGTKVVDEAGSALVREWILQLPH